MASARLGLYARGLAHPVGGRIGNSKIQKVWASSSPILRLNTMSSRARLTAGKTLGAQRRGIASGEKPPMIHERLTRLAADSQQNQDTRMGWLKLGTYASCVGFGTYLVLYGDFKDWDGKEYEHCFMPIRRAYRRQLDRLLGVTDEKTN